MLKGTVKQHIILPVHPQLSKDTLPIVQTEHCHIRLMNDSRWPWIILIPVNDEISELHQLPATLQHAFMDQVNQVAAHLQDLTECRSINVAMLGNVVSQLHCHVIARDESDPNWPGPVWGFGESVPYSVNPDWFDSLKSTLSRDLGA